MSVAEELKLNQYLTFILNEEPFGVSITTVREVLEQGEITVVPCTPAHVRGVVNLRGNVVPVIDLKMKFGIGETVRAVNTCIVIVEVEVSGDEMVVGFLADSVQEVFDINPEDIEPPPKTGTNINTDFIKGMGKRGEEFVVLLQIDSIFNSDEAEDFRNKEGA